MTVSIIIAVKTWRDNLEECISKCQELDYPDFEIIILPDSTEGTATEGTVPDVSNTYGSKGTVPVKIIPTSPVSPGKKRDMAVAEAKGEILAFIDDDVYPTKDWLKNALENFKDEDVAAVGGPAITSPDDSLRQKASGVIYSSPLVSGNYIYRYVPKNKRQVEDYPSCNFLVRKSIMQELGGFNTDFWPGEDTKLCLDITKKLGKIIIYDPQVVVFHHRRALFKAHLKQVASYALHRGYFVKRFPETSLRVVYFIPSILFLGLVLGGAYALLNATFRGVYILAGALYLLIALAFSLKEKLTLALWVFLGIILTHLTYGFYLLKGLTSLKLKEESNG